MLENLFNNVSVNLISFFIFVVSATLATLVWGWVEKIELSSYGTFMKTILCFINTILGFSAIGGFVYLWASETPALADLMKQCVEAFWLPYVFIKGIGVKGRYIVLPLIFLYVGFNLYIVYFAIFSEHSNASNFSGFDVFESLLVVFVCLFTYFLMSKNTNEIND